MYVFLYYIYIYVSIIYVCLYYIYICMSILYIYVCLYYICICMYMSISYYIYVCMYMWMVMISLRYGLEREDRRCHIIGVELDAATYRRAQEATVETNIQVPWQAGTIQ